MRGAKAGLENARPKKRHRCSAAPFAGGGRLGLVKQKKAVFTSANTPHKNRIVVTVVVTFWGFST
jgi:hypothetical protein